MERRPNSKPAEAPSKATTSEAPAAPSPVTADSPLPDRLAALEQLIGEALSSSEQTAAELGNLLAQLERAVVAAAEHARLQNEKSLDPLASPDPVRARQSAEDASFLANRLATLKPRLSVACAKQVQKESVAAYLVKRDALASERDALQTEFIAEYETLSGKLLALFGRLRDFQQRAQIALADPPAGVRGLDGFTAATLRLLEQTKLLDLETGKEIWPPLQQPFAVVMVESMRFNPDVRFSPEWWRAGEQRAEAARIENERTGIRFEEMKRSQEERMNREEKENFLAAHGRIK
jgi:hypothetical protein